MDLEFSARRNDTGGVVIVAQIPEGSAVIAAMGKAFARMFEEAGGGPNYLECRIVDPAVGRLVVTVQRSGKLTPHGARLAAEAEVKRLRAFIEENGFDPGPCPVTFAPDPPAPLTWEAKVADAPWLTYDVAELPGVLRCQRCGATASMPGRSPGSVLRLALEAFGDEHRFCGVRWARWRRLLRRLGRALRRGPWGAR